MRLIDYLINGSRLEDETPSRTTNHFHNPLKEEAVAGLDQGPLQGNSALLWARESPGNEWNYRRMKDYRRQALTAPTEPERLWALARMTRAVGQILHLVEDMGVPAHTRNDSFPGHFNAFSGKLIPVTSHLELHLTRHPALIRPISASEVPAFTRFEDYFDTGSYRTNGNLPVSGIEVGLSEFSNSNYLSELAMFPGEAGGVLDFPHPGLHETYPWEAEEEPGELYPEVAAMLPVKVYRTYLGRHAAQADRVVDHLSVAGYWFDFLDWETRILALWLDDDCRTEYASRLAPRSTAYAAGLLAHIFRANLDFTFDPGDGLLTIVNNGEDIADGSFTMAYDRVDGTRGMARWRIDDLMLMPGASVVVPFGFPSDTGLDGTLALLFEGTIGGGANEFFGREKKLGGFRFALATDHNYSELKAPIFWDDTMEFERNDDYILYLRYVLAHFQWGSGLSAWTISRGSEFRINMGLWPQLCRQTGIDCELIDRFTVNASTQFPKSEPDFVQYFGVAVGPEEWKTVYDPSGVYKDEGWSGMANPTTYLEGLWNPSTGFIDLFRGLPSYENLGHECSPLYSSGGVPSVSLKFYHVVPIPSGESTQNCPNEDETVSGAAAFYQRYREFHLALPPLTAPYADLLFDAGWLDYGFVLRLKRLDAIVDDHTVTVLDRPVTFLKPWGRNVLHAY